MNGNAEQLLKTTLTALLNAWDNMGSFAWVLLGVLLIAGIVYFFTLLRWVLRGGLSNRYLFR
jgi:hypothetical protein